MFKYNNNNMNKEFLKTEKTLVILLGNARGGEQAWESMFNHLIEPYNADLALCFGKSNDHSSILYKNAKYIWEIDEYENWRQYYEINFPSGKWENLFLKNTHESFAGGIDSHQGSGAVVLAFRHFLINNYEHILKLYDRIILTRSDHLHIKNHPILKNDNIYIVEGEDYGGICDRHHIFPSKYSKVMLGGASYMSSELGYLMLKDKNLNTERFFKYYFQYNLILDKIVRFERTFFCVARTDEQTRGSKGFLYIPGFTEIKAKYLDEYHMAMLNLVKK